MVATILANYGIKATSIQKQGHRFLYKITAGSQQFALKRFDDWDTLSRQMLALQQLNKNGFKNMPSVILTLERHPTVCHEGKGYVLTEWVQGTKPQLGKLGELCRASTLLAKFHIHAHSLSVSPDHGYLSFAGVKTGKYSNGTILARIKRWAEAYKHPVLKEALKQATVAYEVFPHKLLCQLWQKELQHGAFVHGDFCRSNILRQVDGNMVMIDFDHCSTNIRIFDLAFFCHHAEPTAHSLLNALKAYHAVRPLTQKEFLLLKAQLMVPERIYWEIHVRLFLKEPLDEDWLSRNIEPLIEGEFINTVRTLQYGDL